MSSHKRVAVIGGGYSGLAMVKALKEDSIDPVCFEKLSETGGTWFYRKEPIYGAASLMPTTIINHSKEMGAFSTYPFPDDCPNYMKHHELNKHMMNIARKYDLLKHVLCNREVAEVRRPANYEETGRWLVTVKNTESGETATDVFDAVAICTGQFSYPVMPSFPGMNTFRGKIIHSHSLKTFQPFADQRVVVVGTGCSALDAAVEISNVASQVYLSVRTPSWIMPRVGRHGLPFDYILLRRYSAFIQSILPIKWSSKIVERLYLDAYFNHKLYGINPKYPFLCREPIVNDAVPSKLLSGSILLRKNISKIEEDGVIFEGEMESTKIDTIIMATGYKWQFPFLEEGVFLEEGKGKILLYKNIFPPHLKHPTLVFIGFVLPLGPGFPIGELQTRWSAYVFSGKGCLPSKNVMMSEIEKQYQENAKRYSPSDKMSVRVDNVPYMDDIASQFGAKPNFWKMAFTDPRLFFACIFGPCLSYQYRLEGPHKWEGARKAILTAPQRVKFPLTVKEGIPKKNTSGNFLLQAALTVFLIVFLLSWSTSSIKYFLMAVFVPYYLTVRRMFNRWLLILLLLPFMMPLRDFVLSYFITLFVPIIMAAFVRL